MSRTYVPNQYLRLPSPQDRAQFEGYEDGVKKELSDYLLEHARERGVGALTRPTVELRTDDRLSLGEFGIQAKLVQPAESGAKAEPEEADFGHTMVYSPTRARAGSRPLGPCARAMLMGGTSASFLRGAGS